jgi:predicted  nucleic acid-binding Zn-ribbon protein
LIAQLRTQQTALASDLVEADTAVSDLELDQARAETDLEPVRQRLVRNTKRIGDGSVTDPKALNALVEEVEHLKKRISDLEDAELEVMEALETAVARREELQARARAVADEFATLAAKRDRQVAELDAEAADQLQARRLIATDVPADLLALYVKVAAGHGGVGAAELRSRRCTGCTLEINPSDLGRFAAAPADQVLRCEECSRILVRTTESGL